jgi:hypothetical protein
VIRDISLAHGDDPALRAVLRPYQVRALDAIATCGTAAAGLHLEFCDNCGDRRLKPNTCGNRCCPHCQGHERAQWVAARTQELLPCGYYHVVITLPPDLRPMAQAHPEVVLGGLMRAGSDAIDHLCRDPRFLGGEVGQLAVLHTWRRDLHYHPHVHIIVSAGGWHARHLRWIHARTFGTAKRRAFLLPKDLLSIVFLRRLRRVLLTSYDEGAFGDAFLPELASRQALNAHLRQVLAKPSVLRIERPFGSAATLLKYLGAYVNRVAISPQRILAHDPVAGTVTYTWTTNAEPDRARTATIPAKDFLKLFAQHILPPGFHRIRFRGLWSTAHRNTKLRVVQKALNLLFPSPLSPPPPQPDPKRDLCARCGLGHYQRIPGLRSRPSPADRRRILEEIRSEARSGTPVRAANCA